MDSALRGLGIDPGGRGRRNEGVKVAAARFPDQGPGRLRINVGWQKTDLQENKRAQKCFLGVCV